MTKEEKIEFLSRLFMYGAKVGFDSDIYHVEYFIYSIARDMGVTAEDIRPLDYLDETNYEISGSEESVMDDIRKILVSQNP